MKQELSEARSKLEAFEARVTDAENDAEAKAEEVLAWTSTRSIHSFQIHLVKKVVLLFNF